MKRHPCLADGCPEVVPGGYVTCSRHWVLVPADLRAELRRAKGHLGVAVALVNVVAWLNARVELDAVPPPGDHAGRVQRGGVVAVDGLALLPLQCDCAVCACALHAALRMRGVEELDWVGPTWERERKRAESGPKGGGENPPEILA